MYNSHLTHVRIQQYFTLMSGMYGWDVRVPVFCLGWAAEA